AGTVDELPSFFARRVLEGRASGASPQRLTLLPLCLYRGHPSTDRVGRIRTATEASAHEDPIGGSGVAPGPEAHIVGSCPMKLPATIDGFRPDEPVADLAAEGTGVHSHGATDRSRDAGHELQAAAACV